MAAKESKKGAARPRRSKEETQHEFARIQEDVEAAQLSTDAKTAEAARLHEAQVRQRVDGVSVEARCAEDLRARAGGVARARRMSPRS